MLNSTFLHFNVHNNRNMSISKGEGGSSEAGNTVDYKIKVKKTNVAVLLGRLESSVRRSPERRVVQIRDQPS